MLIIMSSPGAIVINGKPHADIVNVLTAAKANKNPVGLISNHKKPDWFDSTFEGTNVQFLQTPGRQDGAIVAKNADKFSLAPYDVLVLAAKLEDIQMGKNGGAVLVAAGWSQDPQVQKLGIRIDSAAEFQAVIDLTAGWSGHWWFTSDMPRYSVRALADLSGYGKGFTQQEFATKLTSTVKGGGPRLNALLAVTARSLLKAGFGSTEEQLVWGVYPSSKSANDDMEVLSDFTHRLRTTVSRVRFAKRGEPLFIRHTPSPKRSAGGGGPREDPTSQVTTLHINPFYQQSGRLLGKHVIVVDDCTTYGVSFGVAAAFLRKAGAASVTGLALGKFGNRLSAYDIELHSSPFAPISAAQFTLKSQLPSGGITNDSAQHTLLQLIP